MRYSMKHSFQWGNGRFSINQINAHENHKGWK